MSDMYANDGAAAGLAPGTRLNGIFEIEQRIATGGLGVVYRGRAIETGVAVAIKVLRTDLADNEMALALFRREASALHHIHHEAIVRYYIFSNDPGIRRHYLAMEFVDGEPLSDVLKRGPLPGDEVAQLRERIAAGLHAAHQHGIIHRDVSPDNIIIPDGNVRRAKIIDFGIARSTRTGDRTVIGSGFAGKYNYVSPEQLGLYGGTVTAKSDIYSLGIVLAQCLTGQQMDMGGSEFEVIEKRRVVPDLSAVDARSRPLLVHMLQPDPEDRPSSMADVAAWKPDGPPSGGAAAVVRPSPKRRAAKGDRLELAALTLVALLSCFGVAFYFDVIPALIVGPRSHIQALPDPREAEERIGREASAAAERQRIEREVALRREADERERLATLAAAVAAERERVEREAALRREAGERERQEALAAAAAAERERVEREAALRREMDERRRQEAAAAERERIERERRIVKFVNNYQGGDCFFVTPTAVAADRATLDGFGSSVAPFEVLDDEFKRVNGFEALIGVHQVTALQCPAVTFLAQVRNMAGVSPRLDIKSTGLKLGDEISGSVAEFGDHHVHLLLVSGSGAVRDFTDKLRSTGDVKSFTLTLDGGEPGPAQPQILLAIVSDSPLAALRTPSAGPVAEIFARALKEARDSGQILGANAQYLKLEKP
jgi:hypothetical protein